MRPTIFENDPRDRKRRFLRGLTYMLSGRSQDKQLRIKEVRSVEVPKFRERLAEIYRLEFTPDELRKMEEDGMTTGEFTEKYCEVIYRDRGDVDFGRLIGNSMITNTEGVPELVLKEMDKAPKYGINGDRWCDVAEGACSCGASH